MQITRGDTSAYKFQCKNSSGEVILDRADKVYFTVKKSYEDSAAVLQKTIDDMTFDQEGNYHFTIEASDTEMLDYGTYVYDIEITRGSVVKTISQGNFKITYEATWANNKG